MPRYVNKATLHSRARPRRGWAGRCSAADGGPLLRAALARRATMDKPPPLPFFGSPKRPATSRVPPLTELALECVADNCAGIVSLAGIDQHFVVSLLAKIMQRGRLDYRLACVFRDCGHRDLSEAMQSLDLFSSMPTHNVLGPRGSGGCR